MPFHSWVSSYPSPCPAALLPSPTSLSARLPAPSRPPGGGGERSSSLPSLPRPPILPLQPRNRRAWTRPRLQPLRAVSASTMGNEASYPEEICSHFSSDEIKRLSKRFKKLDLDRSGSLSVEEFLSLPELHQNPLVQRVIDVFDIDGNGEVDFKEFILGTSQFSVRGDEEEKLRFAFSIYDIDKDGYISNGELFQVLKLMVGDNLKDWQLQQLVDKTIIVLDRDGDGKISFEEFRAVVGGLDVHKKLVVIV